MRIVFGGDVMLGRLIDEIFLAHGRSPFIHIERLLKEADLACANLECAISARLTWYEGPPKAFYFKARPVAARILAEAGIGLVTLANNHALDAGPDGLRDTLSLLDGQGILHAGAGLDLEGASRPAIADLVSGSVGVLAYCDHQEDFAATPERPGIRFLSLDDPFVAIAVLEQDIARLRTQVQIPVVAFHWQPNWAPVVEERYRRVARACLAAGARVVWGHGPHHFQGVEFAGEGVILYSTGDFVDDYAVDPVFRNDRQLLFAVDLDAERILRVEAFPIEIADGFALPAQEAAVRWIEGTFRRACEAVGSDIEWAGDRLLVRARGQVAGQVPNRPEKGDEAMRESSRMVDERIQHDVSEELRFDPSVPSADIGVRVNDGVVTLFGTVPTLAARHAAEEAAKRVKGVRGVVNSLEVLAPGPVTRTDEDLARDILAAWELDADVPTAALRVVVEQGRVVLEGEVEHAYQREAAERAVRRIEGVRQVVNRVKVLARSLPSAIRRRITHAFVRNAKLDAKDVDIEVEGHTIKLRGTVRSLAERAEAERIAWSVPGVTEVVDELVVRP